MEIGFLFELGWKSALIAGAALLAVALMCGRAPADRAAVLKLAVVLLLLLPLAAAFAPHLEVEAMPAPAAPLSVAARPDPALGAPVIAARAESPSPWPSTGTMLGAAYAAGLLLMLFRLAGGLLTLRRWTRAAEPADCPRWAAALARHGPAGRPAPRLLVSNNVPGPLSWGSARPVILLDLESFFRPEDADAILAHEMAHLERGDWRMLLLARAAVALFWFNPLVWLLEREAVQQAEEAADALALARVEPTAYAQTLLTCARSHAGAGIPANSIAGSGLRRRMCRILEGRGRVSPGSRWTLAAMVGCVAFATPVAALELVEGGMAPEPPRAPEASAPASPAPAPAAPVPVPAAAPQLAESPEAPPGPADPALSAVPVPAAPAANGETISRSVAAALGDMHVEIEHSLATAAQAAEASMRGLAHGAFGMEQGAIGMEEGARQMERQAASFRDRDYRERVIAEARARGQTVSHEELLEAARELDDGADGMRRGAEEMREAAREMRRRTG